MAEAIGCDRIYKADRERFGTAVLVIEAEPQKLSQRNLPHIGRHSPDGFEWGYGGSGPADLALSILVDAVGPDLADKHYQAFKWAFIVNQPPEGFEIRLSEIMEFIYGIGGEQTCQEASY